MKTKSALIGTSVALFFVIFAGLVFLPAVLSSDLLKPRILQEVNRHLEGQLQVSQWKFKWFSGIEAKGITYDHRQQNFFLKVAELKGHRGLQLRYLHDRLRWERCPIGNHLETRTTGASKYRGIRHWV